MVILTLEDTVIIRAYLIGIGNEDHVITYGREIVQYAIEDNANTVITIHNHPHILENLTISSADIATMSQQTSALGFIGIRVHMGIVKSDLSQFKFYFSQEDRPEFDITCKTKREKLEDGEKYNIESYTIEKKCKPFDLSYIDLHMIPRAKRVRKDAPNVSKSTSNSHKNDVTEDRTTSEINLKIGETE
jgi:hypothetical protein